MFILYISILVILIIFSAFFSSAETSLLSINKIKLNLNAKKKKGKAVLLKRILSEPEEFFSTILIGNNFVNVAAASISTVLFTKLIDAEEEVVLIISTFITTVVILIFGEIIPKSYAFRHSESLSYLYAYPIRFFTYLFYPLVKITSWISSLLFKEKARSHDIKDLTIEEIKHFLSSQRNLYRYHPESLRMLHEIIDTVERDIKSIMTPRLQIVALEKGATIDQVKTIILGKRISKIPIFEEDLDHICGVIYARDMLNQVLVKDIGKLKIEDIVRAPIFLSEYSSVNYALQQFKNHGMTMAVILDEYGTTIGILTLNDIFKEIMGDFRVGQKSIRKIDGNRFEVKGNTPVEEVREELMVDLPEKPDYKTLSGLFIYYYGKFPRENAKIQINDAWLIVKRMGRRKIDEIIVIPGSESE